MYPTQLKMEGEKDVIVGNFDWWDANKYVRRTQPINFEVALRFEFDEPTNNKEWDIMKAKNLKGTPITAILYAEDYKDELVASEQLTGLKISQTKRHRRCQDCKFAVEGVADKHSLLEYVYPEIGEGNLGE